MPTSDHSNLMETIGMNDSFDSSSEDQIPMQRTNSRKRPTRIYPRRRNNRANGLSTSPLFKSNYRHGFYTLLKLTFIILSVASLIIMILLCYNLYHRFELLQEAMDRVQSSNTNKPEEMHQVHSRLQLLDVNVTANKLTMNKLSEKLTNLTSDVTVIEGKLNRILEFVQTAPDIAKLPKDVEELKAMVTELGSKMSTDDKEVKITSEKQAKQSVRLNEMETRLGSLEGKFANVADKTNSKFASSVATLQTDMQKLNSVIANVSNILEGLAKSQQKIDQWRVEIDGQMTKIKQVEEDKPEKPEHLEPSHTVKKVLESNTTISNEPIM